MTISYQYPGIFLLLGIFAGYFICVWFFKPTYSNIGKKEYRLFFFIRWLIVALLLIIVFKPEIKWQYKTNISKQHLILLDNSLSLGISDPNYAKQVKDVIARVLADKSLKSKLMIYSFADSLLQVSDSSAITSKEQITDLSQLLQSKLLTNFQSGQSINSLTVVSDGIFNRGNNPLNLHFPFPVNCVVAGKPDLSVDLSIQNVFFNEISNLDQENRWEISIGYANPQESFSAELVVTRNGKSITKQNITIPAGVGNLKTFFDAGSSDKQLDELELVIQSDKQENNYYNNRVSHYQKKADSKEKVLLIVGQPNFDSRFLAQILKKRNIPFDKIEVSQIYNIPANQKYKSAILVGLPKDNSDKFTDQVRNVASGILLFLNSSYQSNYANKLLNVALPLRSANLSGKLDNNKNSSSDFLYNSNNKSINLTGSSEVSFLSDINLPSDRFIPVMNCLFQDKSTPVGWIANSESEKLAVVNLENFWKLVFEVKNLGDNDNFSNFMLSLLDYLSIDGNRQRLTVEPIKKTFNSGEKIIVSGNYFDKNFKPQLNQKIRFSLKKRKEEIYLLPNNGQYRGELLLNQAGFYEYLAEVMVGNQIAYQKDGSFTISKNSPELSTTNPDTVLLKELATKNKGKIVKFDSLFAWINHLPEVNEEQIVKKSRFPTTELWYFLLVIILFTSEWIWRKTRDL